MNSNSDTNSTTSSGTTATTATNTSNTHVQEWSGAHIICNQSNFEELKDTILLDNGSSTSIFANPSMVTNIRTVDKPLALMTNGGELITDQKATVPGFGDVWYDPNSIANIFSFAELKEKHCITYDSGTEDAFNIHLSNKIIKFTRSKNGLYLYKPNNHVLQQWKQLNTNNTINHQNSMKQTKREHHALIAGVDDDENRNNNNQNNKTDDKSNRNKDNSIKNENDSTKNENDSTKNNTKSHGNNDETEANKNRIETNKNKSKSNNNKMKMMRTMTTALKMIKQSTMKM